MPRRRQRRARQVWLTLFALLLQQFALAAHACEVTFAPVIASTDATAADSHCARAEDSHHGPSASDPVCAKHCLPDRATNDLAGAKLPPMLLPSESFPLATAPSGRIPQAWPVAATAAGPPPALRFRVLLI